MKIPISRLNIRSYTEQERNEFSEFLGSLSQSLREQGLIHHIRVTSRDDRYQVIVGSKRVIAAQMLGWDEIDADIVDQDSPDMMAHENIVRFEPPWTIQVELIEALHKRRQDEHGKAKTGRPKGGGKDGWGIRDTAKELNIAIGTVSQDINLSSAVRADPRLRNIKDKKTAMRMIRIEAKRHSLLETQSMGIIEELKNQVFCGSSAELMTRLPDGIFDVCITDPPWIKYSDKKYIQDSETIPVFAQIYRTLKVNSLLYMFCGTQDFALYQKELPKMGFDVCPSPIIWAKLSQAVNWGMKPWHYKHDFELILIAAKGAPTLTSSHQRSGVLSYKVIPNVKRIHPNEKPRELIAQLIKDSTFEDASVLDPFAGSGVVGQVCMEMGRSYTLIERGKTHYEAILARLKETKRG